MVGKNLQSDDQWDDTTIFVVIENPSDSYDFVIVDEDDSCDTVVIDMSREEFAGAIIIDFEEDAQTDSFVSIDEDQIFIPDFTADDLMILISNKNFNKKSRMISVRCPHCQVGLKVDESKIPSHVETFNCPKCKQPISVSFVINNLPSDDSETIILSAPEGKNAKTGKLHVLPNEFTPEQFIRLTEGINIIGRKSPSKESGTAIKTKDKLMSRSHIGIEARPDAQGKYNHYLYDNKSTNRTLYNRNYIEPGEIVILKDNDEIQIGQTRLIFEEDSPC